MKDGLISIKYVSINIYFIIDVIFNTDGFELKNLFLLSPLK